jgi:hypothetical protein
LKNLTLIGVWKICHLVTHKPDAIKKPGGRKLLQAGREVFFIATLLLVLPGAVRE